MRAFLTALVAACLVAACSSNPADSNGGSYGGGNGGGGYGGGGTEEGVSFSSDVLPILTSSCGGVGCHAPSAQSGVTLTSYGSLMSSVGDQYGTNIVIAGNADASPMVEKIAGTPRFGARMPLGLTPLSAARITTIRTWIDEGARDN